MKINIAQVRKLPNRIVYPLLIIWAVFLGGLIFQPGLEKIYSLFAGDRSKNLTATDQADVAGVQTSLPVTKPPTISADTLFESVNQWRAENKLTPFYKDEQLCNIAQIGLNQVKKEWAQSSIGKITCPFCLGGFGINTAVLYSESDIIKSWLGSAETARNLRSSYNYSCAATDGVYVVQIFANFSPPQTAQASGQNAPQITNPIQKPNYQANAAPKIDCILSTGTWKLSETNCAYMRVYEQSLQNDLNRYKNNNAAIVEDFARKAQELSNQTFTFQPVLPVPRPSPFPTIAPIDSPTTVTIYNNSGYTKDPYRDAGLLDPKIP